MKQQTKLIVLMMSFCFVLATCLLSVFAVKNFDLNMVGEIEFVAPGIEATISQATLLGISKKEDSGQMQEFTLTRTMTESQISDLAGVKSWSGIKLLFDEDSEGQATILFTITNNSEKAIENIMVEISTNTTNESTIQATPSADFCIAPKASHTFDIKLNVADISKTTSLSGFKLTVEMSIIKPNEVMSTSEQKEINGLEFSTDSTAKKAVFTYYTASTAGATGLEIEIPSVVKDSDGNLYTVTEIKDGNGEEDYAFYSVKDTITSINLPSTLTKIGKYSFYGCTTLTGSLKIPYGVISIDDYAFYGCSGLTGDLIIPNSVTSMGISTFANCTGLNGVLTISNNLTNIPDYAFYSCKQLTGDIIIPNSINIIGKSAFYKCTNFKGKLVLGNNLTTIDNAAFYSCTGISGNLIVPNSVTTIGNSVFYNCVKFTGDLIIPNSVLTIGEFAFQQCENLNGTITIGNNVQTIGKQAFYNCRRLTGDLVIPNSVTSIGASTFRECANLSGDLIIGDGVQRLTISTFANAKFSGELKIGSGLTYIETGAVSGSDFSTITASSANTTYYSSGNCLITKNDKIVVLGCKNSIIPQNENITEIGRESFLGRAITTVKIPETVTKIEYQSFTNCQNLTSVVIPDKVEFVGNFAFQGCTSLVSIVIGSGIKTLGNCSIRNCTKLTSVTINAETPPTIDSTCFVNTNDCTIYVKSSCLELYKTADYWTALETRIQAIAS